MICYKDKTFCELGNECDLALTPKVLEDAKKWWGNKNAPISIINKFDCYKPIKEKI